MIEIERKFLVTKSLDDIKRAEVAARSWLTGVAIEQCYLGDTGGWAIRARKEAVFPSGIPNYILTMKRRQTAVTNTEIETSTWEKTYQEMVAVSPYRPLCKNRWSFGRFTIDEFLDPEFDGLLLAEIELTSEDEAFERPDWLGDEVTGDPRYINAAMIERLRH